MVATMYAYTITLAEVGLPFRFLDGKKRLKRLPFFLAACVVANLTWPIPAKLALVAGVLLVYSWCVNRWPLQNAFMIVLALLAVMQFCHGLVNALIALIGEPCYRYEPNVMGKILMIAGDMLALGLTALVYSYLAKYMKQPPAHSPYDTALILLPLMLILSGGVYMGHVIYTNVVVWAPTAVVGWRFHLTMLLLQLFGLLGVGWLLWFNQKLQGYRYLYQACVSLTNHIKAAQVREKKTQDLRHDWKNHLLIVQGLLSQGRYQQAQNYIAQMSGQIRQITPIFATGHPLVDILLTNKAALAAREGITLEGALYVPYPCAVSDMDWVILLANGLDNAIAGCQQLSSAKQCIRLESYQQGDIWLCTITNPCARCAFQKGIGLANMEQTAAKYGGKIAVSQTDGIFCLRILLIISQQS